MNRDKDYEIALRLQKQFDKEVGGKKKTGKKNSQDVKRAEIPKLPEGVSLVDKSLEYLDPNPDIHALFLHFNDVFFWGKLLAVEVRWSPRMTSCAGVCCYEGRGRLCSIRLSLPLLKLRPRKDLIETLLHEMIHAYLFVTFNNRDRDGHGPEFHKHMYRINKSAGTKITVFHSFHDEVRSYQQHWWQCQGPCRSRKPFFGMVRRAMNRAPGPNDLWWAEHQATCGGKFVKVREPEGFKSSKKGGKEISIKTKSIGDNNLTAIGPKKTSLQSSGKDVGSTPSKSTILGYFSPTKDDVTTKDSKKIVSTSTFKDFVPFSGEGRVLGGSGENKRRSFWNEASVGESSNKQPRLTNVIKPREGKSTKGSSETKVKEVSCPICNVPQPEDKINQHLDKCLAPQEQKNEGRVKPSSSRQSGEESWRLQCPGCLAEIDEDLFDDHLDGCDRLGGDLPPGKLENKEEDDDSDIEEVDICVCPTCGDSISGSMLGEHLDLCLWSMSF